jgi:HD-GYP domain-containing protein (c-di-GMP phosphodiesterase class II)
MPINLYYFRPFALPSALRKLASSYKLIPVNRDEEKAPAWELPAVWIADEAQHDLARLEKLAPKADSWRVVCLLDGGPPPRSKLNQRVFAVLPRKIPVIVLQKTIERAVENLRAQEEHARTRQELQHAVSELETLNRIGVALSTERNTEALLDLILSKSREITSSDAGSLYMVEEEPSGGKHLVFKLTQGDSKPVPFKQFTLPIDTRSIAGYSAATGQILNIKDAYRIRHLPLRHNRDFDRKFGYRTKSMLVVPMKNQKDEVIGVLQLINAKRHAEAKLTTPAEVQQEVIPYSERSQELASSLASQAAVALENNLLYRDIERLFEGFVKASVTAIESRDPTTFGHSERVAKLTVALAEAVDRSDSGPYKDLHFTREDIREIRYASILHDFGKVGVREEVLVKAKKLYPSQLELVRKRFLYIRKAMELESFRRKLDYVLRNGNQNFQDSFAQIDGDQQEQSQTLEEFLNHILQANEPSVLPEKTSEKLIEIAGWTFQDPSGPSEALLAPDELKLLSIRKGSLNEEERLQIESHVVHSFRFLSQIPWTKELKRIPEIARAHHEKLDGTGYPYRMKSEDIPFQSKMMTISDIYDALTARDRPYKRAVPTERALDIIGQEVKSQLLDPILFQLFLEAKIYQITAKE